MTWKTWRVDACCGLSHVWLWAVETKISANVKKIMLERVKGLEAFIVEERVMVLLVRTQGVCIYRKFMTLNWLFSL